MIVVTAFKWVPPFAQGQVRDHRVRWVLEEVGWPYEVRLIDAVDQRGAAYRADQPFGQVPTLAEEGRPTLFESGAIVLDVATRAGRLMPEEAGERALMLSWYFAALNSVEPALQAVAEVDFFTRDETVRAARRPGALKAAARRLRQLDAALGDRHWLVGNAFTLADLMTASVLKIVRHTDLLDAVPRLAAYRDRCLSRPAAVKALDDQCAVFAAHGMKDMRYGE